MVLFLCMKRIKLSRRLYYLARTGGREGGREWQRPTTCVCALDSKIKHQMMSPIINLVRPVKKIKLTILSFRLSIRTFFVMKIDVRKTHTKENEELVFKSEILKT